jgi:SSS family solute:Na+ symporter
LREKSLADPDLAYITLVRDFLPDGLRGIILMGLFASLMSTLDSIYNSVSTLWSIDIYKKYIRPDATESEIVGAGKKSILAAFITGALFSFVVLYVKFDNPTFPLTHWFNQLSYFVKNGFVIIIMSAVFLLRPSRKLVLFTMLFSMPLTYLFMKFLPDMNYFIRSAWVILLSFGFISAATFLKSGELFNSNNMLVISDKYVGRLGILLALSLIFCHIIFH